MNTDQNAMMKGGGAYDLSELHTQAPCGRMCQAEDGSLPDDAVAPVFSREGELREAVGLFEQALVSVRRVIGGNREDMESRNVWPRVFVNYLVQGRGEGMWAMDWPRAIRSIDDLGEIRTQMANDLQVEPKRILIRGWRRMEA